MTIQAVIWDLGGVLLRTEDPAPRQRLAAKFGLSSGELERLFYSGDSGNHCQLGEITFEQHVENIHQELNLAPEEMDSFIEQFWEGDRFDYGLVDYIRQLQEKYKTGLLSNAFSNLRTWLDQGGKVDGAFDAMVISAEVGLLKPDPLIYHLALLALDISPGEVIFIDDMQPNIDGAHAVGMHAIHFQNKDQALRDLEEILKV